MGLGRYLNLRQEMLQRWHQSRPFVLFQHDLIAGGSEKNMACPTHNIPMHLS
jgi:hypothetical protein